MKNVLLRVVVILMVFGSPPIAKADKYTLSPEVVKLGDSVGIDKIAVGLLRHDASVLAVVPVPGPDKDLARLFKRNNLVITNNGDASCWQAAKVKGQERPGCLISIFVSRKRPSGKYSDLAGFQAMWFRGLGDKAFMPVNGWAEHIANGDAWIAPGGMIDISDRP